MRFKVDPSSPIPLYSQLKEQIRLAVASGLLGPGDRLPTVRELAAELQVNPTTTARAFRDLEREGVVRTQRGRGSFVVEIESRITAQARRDILTSEFSSFMARIHGLDLSDEELRGEIHRMVEEFIDGRQRRTGETS